jgi:hypothetical protein
MRANKDSSYENDPLCRFGPGGEFIWHWPGDEILFADKPLQNELSKVLARLKEIISGALRSEKTKEIAAGQNLIQSSAGSKETGYGNEETRFRQPHAATSAVASCDIRIPSGQLLFADDWRAGKVAEYKPKHRVRAYKPASKKRPSYELLGQGTLFGADLKSIPSV